jgi:hypothetical protein
MHSYRNGVSPTKWNVAVVLAVNFLANSDPLKVGPNAFEAVDTNLGCNRGELFLLITTCWCSMGSRSESPMEEVPERFGTQS